MPEKLHIISLSVHHLSFTESLNLVMDWAMNRKSAFICFANVHMTMEAHKDKNFLADIEKANLVLADGKPIAVACNLLYHKKQERISGMDFMPQLLELLNEKKGSAFFYGSTPEVSAALKHKISSKYPDIIQAGFISPAFGETNDKDTSGDIEQINKSGAQVIFVSLGCPKQEKWMAANSQKINGVLLGVGAVFPVMAGLQKRAPFWMQKMALEWLYRLWQQPGRLFKRYLTTNFTFLFLLLREWIKKSLK